MVVHSDSARTIQSQQSNDGKMARWYFEAQSTNNLSSHFRLSANGYELRSLAIFFRRT